MKLRRVGHIVIGNPENRRVQMFCEAVHAHGLATPIVVPYLDLLDPNFDFFAGARIQHAVQEISASFSKTCLRIESPGECWKVERRFIASGSDCLPAEFTGERIGCTAALRLRESFGRVRFLRQFQAGFERFLSSIEALLKNFPNVRSYNPPKDIQLAFDKPKCHAAFAFNELPVAEALEHVTCLDDLLAQMEQRAFDKVMIKYAYGSSASCIIALSYSSKRRLRATTTMEVVRGGGQTKIFNNLLPQTYSQRRMIENLVNRLCRETVHVERWLPRLSWRGRVFDFRVVVIAGRASHVVARTSSSPFTNLHLGNRRGELAEIKKICGIPVWNRVHQTAEAAATQCFPSSHYLGFDILVQAGCKQPTLIEANAFGDLLPGISYSGQSTYLREVATMSAGLFRHPNAPHR